MKTLKLKLLFVLVACFFLTACSLTADYMGERFTPTSDVDIFYAERDIKIEHKVIGHFISSAGRGHEAAKKRIIEKARAVGADGVIFFGVTLIGGEETYAIEKADAVKYTAAKKEEKN